jgi:hypothetical protein
MIKTIIIFLQFTLLVGGAALSRPSRADFDQTVAPATEPGAKKVWEGIFHPAKPADMSALCDYRNRVLWADVYLNDKHVATGLFGRWFWTADGKAEMMPKP